MANPNMLVECEQCGADVPENDGITDTQHGMRDLFFCSGRCAEQHEIDRVASIADRYADDRFDTWRDTRDEGPDWDRWDAEDREDQQ